MTLPCLKRSNKFWAAFTRSGTLGVLRLEVLLVPVLLPGDQSPYAYTHPYIFYTIYCMNVSDLCPRDSRKPVQYTDDMVDMRNVQYMQWVRCCMKWVGGSGWGLFSGLNGTCMNLIWLVCCWNVADSTQVPRLFALLGLSACRRLATSVQLFNLCALT